MFTAIKRILPDPVLDAAKFVYYPTMLAFRKLDDEPEMAGLRYFVGRGDCVVDIGANLGVYTHELSRLVGPEGVVHAFEPVPRTFSFLQWSVRVLRRRNVVLHRCALSHTSGWTRMNIPRTRSTGRKNYYMATVSSDVATGDSVHTVANIPLRALTDELTDSRRAVAFLKCDVEGHELAVFKGAAPILAADKPAILVEISGDPDDRPGASGELFVILQELGYEPFVFREGSFHRRLRGDRYVNYFFLTPGHIAGLSGSVPQHA